MPVSPELRQQIVTFYVDQFGVPQAFLETLTLEANKEEIWGTTGSALPGIYSARATGLRIGRNFPRGFKPTSVFLAALGPLVTQSRIDVHLEDLRTLLLGHRISYDGTASGYVALVFQGDIIGCGRCHDGRLHALIPTGRRRELLGLLETQT